jgi:CBS domain-containing protein
MSPRAAWRLESLGFRDVYWYPGGKADWAASGLPVEGRAAQVPRVGAHLRRDVPTCRPDERVGEIRERVRAANWNTCFVVTAGAIVLGRLFEKELAGPDSLLAADAMRSGPTTFRPDVTVHQIVDYMREHELTTMPVTTSEGRLLGLALIEDLEAAHGGARSGEQSSRRSGSER